jgi:hypothetical protein
VGRAVPPVPGVRPGDARLPVPPRARARSRPRRRGCRPALAATRWSSPAWDILVGRRAAGAAPAARGVPARLTPTRRRARMLRAMEGRSKVTKEVLCEEARFILANVLAEARYGRQNRFDDIRRVCEGAVSIPFAEYIGFLEKSGLPPPRPHHRVARGERRRGASRQRRQPHRVHRPRGRALQEAAAEPDPAAGGPGAAADGEPVRRGRVHGGHGQPRRRIRGATSPSR